MANIITELALTMSENWYVSKKLNSVGRVGENTVTKLIIEPVEILDNVTYELEIMSADGSKNVAELTIDGTELYLILTANMLTTSGIVKMQLRAVFSDGSIKKSNIFELKVNRSISATDYYEEYAVTIFDQLVSECQDIIDGAEGYVERAETAAENAETYAESASASAESATASATTATASAEAASTAATSAETSATNASTSAETATTAAASASASATTAVGASESAQTASTTAQTASETAVNASTTAQAAAESAENSATSASTSANNASTSATSAASSATNAATSETNAHTSEVNAGTSETNASGYCTRAENAAESIEASAEQIATNAANISTNTANIADIKGYIGYTDGDIYGIEADFVNNVFTRIAANVGLSAGADFDNIEPWHRRRCNLTDSGVVTAYYGDTAYTETGALTEAVTIDGTEYAVGTQVQVMVEQPKFYYKVVPLLTEKCEGEKGVYLRKARYYISATQKDGFKLHPAFIRNGTEYDKIYLSAYEGCAYDISEGAYITDDAQSVDFTATSGDKLSSIASAKPMSGTSQSATRANCRIIASNRGTNWTQSTIQSISATQLLFIIEYGGFNSQDLLGAGITSASAVENTGYTSALGNASGNAPTSTTNVNAVTYRGEENFYGNIWTFVDGINAYNYGTGEIYVSDNNFADDTKTSPYESANITARDGNGFISAFAYSEDYDWLFIASETSGNSSLPVGDNFWQNKAYSGYTVALLGGRWDSGSYAGGFGWNVRSASSNRGRYVGGRLLYM